MSARYWATVQRAYAVAGAVIPSFVKQAMEAADECFRLQVEAEAIAGQRAMLESQEKTAALREEYLKDAYQILGVEELKMPGVLAALHKLASTPYTRARAPKGLGRSRRPHRLTRMQNLGRRWRALNPQTDFEAKSRTPIGL